MRLDAKVNKSLLTWSHDRLVFFVVSYSARPFSSFSFSSPLPFALSLFPFPLFRFLFRFLFLFLVLLIPRLFLAPKI